MGIRLEVWGEYACFTRPEMKVERVSYDVITPSAARGIIEAIYWHPGMRWIIDQIQVCNPIRFTNIRRNEVKATASAHVAKQYMEKGSGLMYIDASSQIVQRASMLLRDVCYIIDAHFEMTSKQTPGDNPGKFQDIITRRIKRGQFYHQPYLGCREFPAFFQAPEMEPKCPDELKGERDLGYMLYDMDFSDTDDIHPMFFRAIMKDGTICVPDRKSGEVIY